MYSKNHVEVRDRVPPSSGSAAVRSTVPQAVVGKDEVRSKRESIERLQASALQIFSSKGFDGTSLRNIADHANVPLSTINRYFGSKLDLFNEIEICTWRDVNRDREALFKNPRFTDHVGSATLHSVLYAFVHPVVLLSVGPNANPSVLRFLREFVARKYHEGETTSFLSVAERWVEAIMKVEPGLSRARAVWALGFTVNVTFSDQMLCNAFGTLLPRGSVSGADELTEMIIDFCAAGIRAITR
jgi:AcrR family transcriptional regulator